MLEQIKDLCLFMICGQTLLYFQSGKKYEKICRMILELLVLAGIVGMILNFLQSFGFRKGEMEAAGGAVAGMQRSMEEALSRQLGEEGVSGDFLAGDALESLIEKYTTEEIKSRYNSFAKQYGFEIDQIKEENDKLQVFLKEISVEEEARAENTAKIVGIEQIEIGKIALNEMEDSGAEEENREESPERSRIKKEEMESFRRQLALVFAVEEEKLEVILVD